MMYEAKKIFTLTGSKRSVSRKMNCIFTTVLLGIIRKGTENKTAKILIFVQMYYVGEYGILCTVLVSRFEK